MRSSWIAAVLVLAAAASPAAQESGSLTLEQAVTAAQANSQRIAELQARMEGATYAVDAAHAAAGPNVSAQAGYTRTNHVDAFAITLPGRPPQVVYPDIPDNYRTRLDLQWPIFTGGRTGALARAAAAEQSATGDDLAAARADLKLEVTRAFWALVTARETAQVLDRSLDAIAAQVTDLRNRQQQGLLPPNDVLSAEAQQSHQRLLAAEASAQAAIAEADLRRLTGLEGAAPLVPAYSADALPATGSAAANPAAAEAVTSEIAQAVRARPERRALLERVTSADERATAANGAKWPQIAFAAGYDYARPNPRIFPRQALWNTSWDVGVNLTWSLWDSGRRKADVGQARANAAALRTRVADFDRNVTFEVRERTLELDAAREAIGAADDGVRAARESERVTTERYRAGVATPTDVLEAQVARLQAELDRTRALADYRLAQARLERAMGR